MATSPEYPMSLSDERAIRIADALGARHHRGKNVFYFTLPRCRKFTALYHAGFDVTAPLLKGPRFQRNGGPMVPMNYAVLIGEAFAEGRAAS